MSSNNRIGCWGRFLPDLDISSLCKSTQIFIGSIVIDIIFCEVAQSSEVDYTGLSLKNFLNNMRLRRRVISCTSIPYLDCIGDTFLSNFLHNSINPTIWLQIDVLKGNGIGRHGGFNSWESCKAWSDGLNNVIIDCILVIFVPIYGSEEDFPLACELEAWSDWGRG